MARDSDPAGLGVWPALVLVNVKRPQNGFDR